MHHAHMLTANSFFLSAEIPQPGRGEEVYPPDVEEPEIPDISESPDLYDDL